jgi:hypothetical protein
VNMVGNLIGKTKSSIRIRVIPGEDLAGQKKLQNPARAAQLNANRYVIATAKGRLCHCSRDRSLRDVCVQSPACLAAIDAYDETVTEPRGATDVTRQI